MKKLKQLLSNKNFVTLVGAILIAIVIYVGYNMRLSSATSPVRVPYALESIDSRTEITDKMIGYVDVPQSALRGDIITNVNNIKGKYTKVQTQIPKGSFFYNGTIVEQKDLPDAYLDDLEENEIAYKFSVNMTTTYGNSMVPGRRIDIYFRYEDENGNKNIGKLIENVEILALMDSSGHHVFESINEERIPSLMIFKVTPDIHILMEKAEYVSRGQDRIILVPVGGKVKEMEEDLTLNVSSETIRQYIEREAATAE